MSISLVGSMEHPSCALWSGFARVVSNPAVRAFGEILTALRELIVEPGRMPFATQFIQLLSISEQR